MPNLAATATPKPARPYVPSSRARSLHYNRPDASAAFRQPVRARAARRSRSRARGCGRCTARCTRASSPRPWRRRASSRIRARWRRCSASTTRTVASPAFAQVFGGNALLEGMEPYAANYGGHQFGHWAGQLGDGRAITLGETINAAGERWELQLKGAGPTPYSRSADGRAVLRSSVREFLCSEAMHHLGVPTTRALCLVATGEEVVRDMFYDGHPRRRARRDRVPRRAVVHPLRQLRAAGFARRRAAADASSSTSRFAAISRSFRCRAIDGHRRGAAPEDVRAEWFAEVCERTARMIAHWMRVGFVHGVMNTDNMSILGLTIDYGPYGWIDDFDLDWTPNTTDAEGRRYRFGQQAADRVLESRPARQRAGAGVRVHRPAARRAAALRRRVHRGRARQHRREAGIARMSATRTSS